MPDDSLAGADKTGDALKAQRFQMLEDIARELTGEPVFPTYFDAALRLRKELQDADLPTPRLARLISAEPLIAAKLLSLANSVLYSPSGTAARNLSAAIDRLGIQLVRTTALTVAITNVMVKRGGDVLTTRAIVALAMGLTVLPFAPFVPLPPAGTWGLIFLSMAVDWFY